MPKRARTFAPGSNSNIKKQRHHPITLIQDFQSGPKLRHIGISKTRDGRRKHKLSCIPLTVANDEVEPDLLAEETELSTFQHFLDDGNDGDWVPCEEESTKNRKSDARKKKVFIFRLSA